jgi:hypothetical protein
MRVQVPPSAQAVSEEFLIDSPLDFLRGEGYIRFMKGTFLTAFLIVLLAAPSLAQKAIDGMPQAKSDGRVITVHWVSTDETGLAGYELARGSGSIGSSLAFIVIFDRVAPKGSNAIYDVVDETAFRTSESFYQYRIVAIYADGHRSEPYFVGVTHSVSSVRRTWGSIKAMFR